MLIGKLGQSSGADRQGATGIRNRQQRLTEFLLRDCLNHRRGGAPRKSIGEKAVTVAILAHHSDEEASGSDPAGIIIRTRNLGITAPQREAARNQGCQFS